ncbi:hypothetical protein CHUAL_013386 [Chamberlinius hualienensis]
MPLLRGVTTKRKETNYALALPGGAESDYDDDDYDYLDSYVEKGGTAGNKNISSNQPPPATDSSQNSEEIKVITSKDNSYSENQLNEFYFAVLRDDNETVKQIIEAGMSVDVLLRNGWNALLLACNRGTDEMVKLLLEKGANPSFNREGFTTLMAACATNSKEEIELINCVKHLVKYGVDVNAKTSSGMTALMLSARDGKNMILDYLIESGANTEMVNVEGWSALVWAIHSGHENIVQSLLEHNPKLASITVGDDNIVMFATKQGQLELAHVLEEYFKSEIPVIKPKTVENQHFQHPLERPFPLAEKAKKSSYDQIDMLLAGLNLSHLTPIFHDNAIEFSQLLLITDDDLIKIGIDKLSVRLKIIQGIRDIHKKEWENSSIQLVKSTKLTCPEAVAIIENIGQHLKLIRSTIKYIHGAIKENPKILEKEQEVKGISQLLEQLQLARNNNSRLKSSLVKFQNHLHEVSMKVEFRPANLIVAKKSSKKSTKSFRSIVAISAALALTVALCLFSVSTRSNK